MENNKRWKPEYGEEYWVVDTNCGYDGYTWFNDTIDNKVFEAGNCFRTKAEAKAAAEKVKELLLHLQEPATSSSQLPKLTTEVFDRADCPEWAKYAVVDIQGLAYWYQQPPVTDERIGVWKAWGNRRQLIDGFFDRSDWQNSLIERPVKEDKLPDWCKVGEWVWRTDVDEYHKVIAVDEFGFNTVTNGIDVHHYWPNRYIKDAFQPARLRPYNTKEMKVLVGKVIEVEPGNFSLCLRVKGGYWADFLDDCSSDDDRARVISYDSFMLKACKTIDGEPCGVFEYFDGNEWVQ